MYSPEPYDNTSESYFLPEIEVGVVGAPAAAAVAAAAPVGAAEESFSLRRRAASSSELEELLLELDPDSSSEDELPEAPEPGTRSKFEISRQKNRASSSPYRVSGAQRMHLLLLKGDGLALRKF